ncbi:MAG: DMT family transporter [Nocardioides sp.]
MRRSSPVLPLSLVFVPIWTSGFVVGKLATQRVDVVTTLAWRFVIASAFMWALVALLRAPLPRGREWKHLAAVGMLLQVGQFGGLYLGLSGGVSAGLSSLAAGMAPLLVGLFGPLVSDERLGVLKVVGLVLGTLGVVIVLSGDVGSAIPWGPLGFTALGMLSLVAGTLYQRRVGTQAPLSSTIAAQNTLSLIVCLPVLAITGQQSAPATTGGWLSVVWLGLIPSCAGFAVFYLMLQLTGTTFVSALLNLVPAATALVSVPILGEPLTLRIGVGLVVALAGMYVGGVLPGRREARKRRAASADGSVERPAVPREGTGVRE